MRQPSGTVCVLYPRHASSDVPSNSERQAFPSVLPHGRLVAERSIEHPSLTVGPGPGKREVVVDPMHAAGMRIDGPWVESEEDMHVVAGPVPELIDLVGELECGRQSGGRRMR